MSVTHRDDNPRLPTRRKATPGLSTDVFTVMNIAVFLVLAASVVLAGYLYSQGA